MANTDPVYRNRGLAQPNDNEPLCCFVSLRGNCVITPSVEVLLSGTLRDFNLVSAALATGEAEQRWSVPLAWIVALRWHNRSDGIMSRTDVQDDGTKSTIQKIPLLTVKAGPRDPDWGDRLKEEYAALIKVRSWPPSAYAPRRAIRPCKPCVRSMCK